MQNSFLLIGNEKTLIPYVFIRIKYIILTILCSIVCCFEMIAQKTIINSTPIRSEQETCRITAVEINENGVIVTCELTALSDLKRLNYWYTKNTYIISEGVYFLKIAGYYINGTLQNVGHDKQWGWDNVKKGESRTYQLFFGGNANGGTLPEGVSSIDIVDEGEYVRYLNGKTLVHSYCWRGISINNPHKGNGSCGMDEKQLRDWVQGINDVKCGIYEEAGKNNRYHDYKLAVVSEDGEDYYIVYISGTNYSWWKTGDIKGHMKMSTSGLLKTDWAMGNKSWKNDCYSFFDEIGMHVFIDKDELVFLKTYPLNLNKPINTSPSNDNLQGYTATGSGIILSTNGVIATNYHVVNGATQYDVVITNGQTINTYKTKLLIADKVNDLALLQIDDKSFRGMPALPYTLKANTSDVGTKVFAMGFPMTGIMGEEIKVTDGIISSKTGIQGDIVHYQINASITHGNSGGPLFDDKGNLIGITSSGLSVEIAQNANYAIKSSYLINLIESSPVSIPIPQGKTVQTMSFTDQIKALQKYVVYVKVK